MPLKDPNDPALLVDLWLTHAPPQHHGFSNQLPYILGNLFIRLQGISLSKKCLFCECVDCVIYGRVRGEESVLFGKGTWPGDDDEKVDLSFAKGPSFFLLCTYSAIITTSFSIYAPWFLPSIGVRSMRK